MEKGINNLKADPQMVIKCEKAQENLSSFQKWKKKFARDFTKKEYLPIKGLFFLIYGANFALLPFLTLQARSLGITGEEVGIIYSTIPIAALLAPTFSGMLADKIGNFKILLSLLTAIAGLWSLLFLVVPVGRVTHQLPELLPIEITCSEKGNGIHITEPYLCTMNSSSFSLRITNCLHVCPNTTQISDESVPPKFNLNCNGSKNCFRKQQPNEYSFVNNSLPIEEEPFSLIVHLSNSDWSEKFNSIITISSQLHETEIQSEVTYSSVENLCPKYTQPSSQTNCFTACDALTVSGQLCTNKEFVQEFSPTITFYSHLFIRLLKEFTLATSMPLIDGAAVTVLQEYKGDFGFQRIYSNIGMMVLTPIAGILIDYFSIMNGFQDFRPAIFMYCGLKLMSAFLIFFLNLESKEGSNKVIEDFYSLLKRPEIIFFLIATFLAGTCFGYIETFLFWLLEDLGADKKLMGITVSVGAFFGIPLLMVSTYIVTNLGHVNTIVLCFLVYIIRLVGYTLISSPWWAMPYEALECFTSSLMVVTSISYAAGLATPAIVVTLQGLYGGLYYGVGRGTGSLIGGFLIESTNIIVTFRIVAVFAGVSGILYLFSNFCLKYFNKNKVISIKDRKGVAKSAIAEAIC